MRNQKRHLAVRQFREALKHFVLRFRVQRRRWFVQNQELGVAQIGPRKRHFLPLAAREVHASLEPSAKNLLVALGKFANYLLGQTLLCCRTYPERVLTLFNFPHRDVFRSRHVVAHEVLEDHTGFSPQVFQVVFAQIHAIQQNLPRGWIVQSREQFHDRRLALPVFSDQSQTLAALQVKTHVAEHQTRVPGISEGNVAELEALQDWPRHRQRVRFRGDRRLHRKKVQQVRHEERLIRDG